MADTPETDHRVDPVTLAVLAGRLEQIADEMDATLFRSAFNPTIAEAHDASHGLYHATTGATLVQGTSGLPVFVGSMSGAVRLVIDTAAARGVPLEDGDVYAFNDPYRGGTHLNDLKMVRPYFRHGKVWCHLASVGHLTDVGGAVPGNYHPGATDTHQEGVCIPPLRLCRAGEVQPEVVDLICSVSRTPTSTYGDLHGQLNALDLGASRLDALLDEYGDDTVAAAVEALTARAATMMRSLVADLPDGTYSVDDWLDNDGSDPSPIAIALDLVVDGDHLTLDFGRSAPAVTGPVNISRSTAVAACFVALKHMFPEVPANGGCLEPVSIVIPDGSVLAADRPKPVGGYTETILRVIDCIFRAVAVADPARATGCSYGTINALSIAGRGTAQRAPWVMFTFYGGGLGGSPESDGLNHGNAPLSTATIPPVEILESRYPVRYTRWELRPDSGGPGRHRGGLGARYEVELADGAADVFVFGDRSAFPPQGVAGGLPAARNRVGYDSPDGDAVDPPLGSKVSGVHLDAGRRVRIDSPGGGGFGDPFERDPDAVARDVRLGYVSIEAAERDYGVVLDTDGGVDATATGARRQR